MDPSDHNRHITSMFCFRYQFIPIRYLIRQPNTNRSIADGK